MSFQIKSFCLGPLQNNGYLLWDDGASEAVAIDPPLESEIMAAFAKKQGLQIKRILNTHCHFDHIGGNSLLSRLFGAGLYIHRKELELLRKGPSQAEYFGLDLDPSPEPEGFLAEGEDLPLGGVTVKVIETPGHTSGGLCFLAGGDLFSGDTLFAGSIGRTDLEGGDFDLIVSSIREKLFKLPPETRVHPGHGPSTTIGREMGMNPFVGEGAGTEDLHD